MKNVDGGVKNDGDDQGKYITENEDEDAEEQKQASDKYQRSINQDIG